MMGAISSSRIWKIVVEQVRRFSIFSVLMAMALQLEQLQQLSILFLRLLQEQDKHACQQIYVRAHLSFMMANYMLV